MSPTLQTLKDEAQKLSERERAELAYFLINSLDAEDPDAEAAWDAELERRANEIEKGAVTGRPAKEVLARLSEKYS